MSTVLEHRAKETKIINGKWVLGEDFINQFRGKQPRWGFEGLGWVVYVRTYSREKADGTMEQWFETAERVTLGNYNTKLVDGKIDPTVTVEEIERFYYLFFNLAITPPGRSLWMSGTEYAETNGDALNNCLRGDTLVHTDQGIFPIKELAGKTVNVLSEGGVYRPAEFKSYGKQDLLKVTLGNGDEFFATPDHLWVVQQRNERVMTKDLQPNYRLPINLAELPDYFDVKGVAHGICYGDGWSSDKRNRGVEIKLFGEKENFVKYLTPYGELTSVSYKENQIPMLYNLPSNFKLLPKQPEMSREYALGFIVGLIATDGNVRNQIRIHQSNKEALCEIRNIAMYAGLITSPVYMDREQNPYTNEYGPSYCFNISTSNLDESHILKPSHQSKFKQTRTKKHSTVLSIEHTDLVEEVYCCVEMETHTMTIGSGILTGQCWYTDVVPQAVRKGSPIKASTPFVFVFDQAMKGGGVGAGVYEENIAQFPVTNNSVELYIVCEPTHPVINELFENNINVMAPSQVNLEMLDTRSQYLVVEDSREGWDEALAELIDAHYEGITKLFLDISNVRERGQKIKRFGGTASGPMPLAKGLQQINSILNRSYEEGRAITTVEAGDIIQIIGTVVVSGNVRRTAIILLGSKTDTTFIESKDYSKMGLEPSQWRWASNNSIIIDTTTSRNELYTSAAAIYFNGEPGVVNLEVSRHYGRIVDGRIENIDGEVTGTNPCGEISLTDKEPCNLFEVNLVRCKELEQIEGVREDSILEEAIYLATRYTYRVTFRTYEWEKSRETIEKNRRLGVGITGYSDYTLLYHDGNYMNTAPILDSLYKLGRETNNAHSKALGSKPSIKITTVKPSGSVSKLMGVSAGQHDHWDEFIIQRIRIASDAPILELLKKCNYPMEPVITGRKDDGTPVFDKNTMVVEFPVKAPTAGHPKFKPASQVPLMEQAERQAILQTYWADNAVSATLTFHKANEENGLTDEEVINEITNLLDKYKNVFKSTSLLPHAVGTYDQMPWETITEDEYNRRVSELNGRPWNYIEGGLMAKEEEIDTSLECVGGSCPIR